MAVSSKSSFLAGFDLNDSTPPNKAKAETRTDTFTIDIPDFTFTPETLADNQAMQLLNSLPDEAS